MNAKMDHQVTETEKQKKDSLISEVQEHLQLLSGTLGKSPDSLFWLSAPLRSGILQLRRLLEVLPYESRVYPDDLPTSFVAVEKAIAQYISGCLADVPSRKKGIHRILTFLRDYKVVRILPDGNYTVSLGTVHLILQDNYPGSSFCNLLNMLLGGFMNTTTKVITF